MKTIQFKLNGEARQFDTWPDQLFIEVLRETFKITSVKTGCAPQQECGGCLILIDGVPKNSCAVRAEQVQGRRSSPSKASPTTSSASIPTPSRRPPACNAASARPAWCCASSG